MANVAYDAIKERLRELVENNAGTVRTIGSRFQGDLPPGLNASEERRRGVLSLAPAEVSLKRAKAHPQRIARMGNVQVHLIDAEVRVVRTLSVAEHVDDDLRDDVEALALLDGDVLTQCFEIPANLHTTAGGTSTGLIGCNFIESVPAYRGKTEGEASDLVTIHRFELTAKSAPASV